MSRFAKYFNISIFVYLLIFVSSCSSHDQVKFKEVESEQKNRLKNKYGDYSYYWFIGHVSMLNISDNNIKSRFKILLKEEIAVNKVCPASYKVVEKSITLPEKGNVTILFYCT